MVVTKVRQRPNDIYKEDSNQLEDHLPNIPPSPHFSPIERGKKIKDNSDSFPPTDIQTATRLKTQLDTRYFFYSHNLSIKSHSVVPNQPDPVSPNCA
ncbi:unnamed protein product [Tuber melanosporum]|uniref:(Perigord truffle) hypothetical protein n=1 Tax=Tuber melanosporum (strain Mel28) TaxID=656061 RepID=D5G6I7_TUBMM|nr:uncharacterized protein GSTUM_00004498001 [Tuber melanosporum]CAZ80130.1 unnamed protein product [Tuber melanosporum]